MVKEILFVSSWSWKVGDKTYYKIKFIIRENDNLYENFITEKLFNKIQNNSFVPYTEYMAEFSIDKNLTLRLVDLG